MSYELSFSPEFFVGPYDLEGIEFDKERPTSVYQAIMVLPEKEWTEIAKEVFGVPMHMLEPSTVMDRIREIDSCTNLGSPVEVWLDEIGCYTLRVYDSTDG